MKFQKLQNHELTRKNPEDFKNTPKIPVTIVLDNIRSLHNIGSVFRTADAFLVEHIYLCGITATPPHKDIQKTALGATQTVSWSHHQDTLTLIKELQEQKHTILAIEQTVDSISLEKFPVNPKENYVLVFGNEVKGVTQQVVSQSNAVIEIPQLGTKHSLNIANSMSIVAWEFFKQLQ